VTYVKKIAIIIVNIPMLFLSVNFYELYELIYADDPLVYSTLVNTMCTGNGEHKSHRSHLASSIAAIYVSELVPATRVSIDRLSDLVKFSTA